MKAGAIGSKIKFIAVGTIMIWAALGTIVMFAGGGGARFSLAEIGLIVVLGPSVAWFGAVIHERGASGLTGLLTGESFGGFRPTPNLGQARVHIAAEEWEAARSELDVQWKTFPGNGEILREYDRLFTDCMKAPSGLNDFFRRAVQQTTGKDKAFIYLRLAEINLEHRNDPREAHMWCTRLIMEFPSSEHAETARRIAEQTKPKPADL